MKHSAVERRQIEPAEALWISQDVDDQAKALHFYHLRILVPFRRSA